jgi:hypothetical protein
MSKFLYRRIDQLLDEWLAVPDDNIAANDAAHLRVRRLMTAAGIDLPPRRKPRSGMVSP